jgi:hypothetical protein
VGKQEVKWEKGVAEQEKNNTFFYGERSEDD